MFAQVNQAEAVDRLGPADLGADAVVKGDDMCPRTQPFLGDRLEQGQAHPFLGRGRPGIDVEHDQVLVGL